MDLEGGEEGGVPKAPFAGERNYLDFVGEGAFDLEVLKDEGCGLSVETAKAFWLEDVVVDLAAGGFDVEGKFEGVFGLEAYEADVELTFGFLAFGFHF